MRAVVCMSLSGLGVVVLVTLLSLSSTQKPTKEQNNKPRFILNKEVVSRFANERRRFLHQSKNGTDGSCDTAFATECLPSQACMNCFLEMETSDIDWASVSSDTSCEQVVQLLSNQKHCTDLVSSQANRDAFCDTFKVCVVWDDGTGDGRAYVLDDDMGGFNVDCSTLTECKWDGFHVGFTGNGICNNYECYNTAICGFDGGDCCADTCNATDSFVDCGHDGFFCRDPASTNCDPLFNPACKNGGSNKTSTNVKPKPSCGDGTSLWTVKQYDSWGDGWDDTAMKITLRTDPNNPIYQGALTSGAQGTDYVCLSKDAACYHVQLNGGMWGKEISWEIKPVAEGASAIAGGGSPMECDFPVNGVDGCSNTCTGKPNVDPAKDPEYKQLKDLYTCIESKCVIQAGACQQDSVCNKCFEEAPADYCMGNNQFNALIDCTMCKCGDNSTSAFCSTKGMGIPPANNPAGGGSSSSSSSKRTCTPTETVSGGAAVIGFSKCINFEQVTMLIPDYDTNNFGLLDKFEACAHSFNTADHGGHTALGCLQILVNAMHTGCHENATAPKEAIQALAKSLYQDGENFCDCAKGASDKCPLCSSFMNFKTLLYESMDACQALDEIDCDAWKEFFQPCMANLVAKYTTIDFSIKDQCDYVLSSCGGAGPFPAFRRLDCDKEVSAEAWDFYKQFSGKCSTGVAPPPPSSQPPGPGPKPGTVPVPSPPNPSGNKTSGKPYVSPDKDATPEDKQAYVPSGSGSKSGGGWRWFWNLIRWFWNLILLALVGAAVYYIYKRRSEGFSFVRYRRMRNNYYNNTDNDMYMGLSLESSTSFEPPTLPPTPTSMGGSSQYAL